MCQLFQACRLCFNMIGIRFWSHVRVMTPAVRDDQPDTREGQAGRPGEAERSAVPFKPGNSGGGKGPQFKTNARRSRVIAQPRMEAYVHYQSACIVMVYGIRQAVSALFLSLCRARDDDHRPHICGNTACARYRNSGAPRKPIMALNAKSKRSPGLATLSSLSMSFAV
jgi:hypothetical protein